MNALWAGMIGIGIIYGAFTGHMDAVSEAVLVSSKEAVTLCVTMLGVMALWMGLMNIAKDAGLIRGISHRIQPFIHFLFPEIPAGHASIEKITMNFVANFLGLGWAATPAGLEAMKELAALEEQRHSDAGVASNEMCNFLILNISSLQLIPVNVIAYRSQYGSVSPTSIVGPAILATACSTLTAIIYCKCKDRKSRKNGCFDSLH